MKLLANRVAWLTNASGANNITINDPVDSRITPTDRFSYGDRVRFLVEDGEEWARYEGVLTDGGAGSDWITRDKFLESSTGSDLDLSNTNGKLCYVEAGAEMLGADGGRLNIATTTGTGAAYLLDLPIPLEQLKDGVEVWFFVHTANTDPGGGNFHTLKVNATDPKPIKAGMPRRRLAFGAMAANALVGCRFNQAGDCWVPITGLPPTWKTITASPYTILEEDHGQTLIFNTAGAMAVAVPEATGQFAGPFRFNYLVAGAGSVTFTPTTSTIAVGAAAPGASMAATSGQSGDLWTDGGNYRATQMGASVAAVAAGSMRNLLWKNNAGTPNSKVDITADEVVLKDAGGNTKLFSAVNVTVDMAAAAGANALDTGTEASSTWYQVWLVGKADGTIGSVFSLSAAAPTMPGGYTFSLLIGAIYNDGSSNFRKTRGDGRRAWQAAVNVLAAGTTSVAGTLQSMSISTAVPPNAKACSGIMGTDTNGGIAIAVAGDANGVGLQETAWNTVAGNLMNGYYGAAPFADVPLITAQTIYRTASSTSGLSRIDVSGWTH